MGANQKIGDYALSRPTCLAATRPAQSDFARAKGVNLGHRRIDLGQRPVQRSEITFP